MDWKLVLSVGMWIFFQDVNLASFKLIKLVFLLILLQA